MTTPEATGCSSNSTTDPPANQGASLPGPGGTCLGLEPAQLVITKLRVTGTYQVSGTYEVDFQLLGSDPAAFDRVASADYHQQLALVMFGVVLSAPQINATSFQGMGEITGLTKMQAEMVVSQFG